MADDALHTGNDATLTVSVGRAPDRARAEEWALVLTAEGIPSRIAPSREPPGILVAPRDAPRAGVVLSSYERERAEQHAAHSARASHASQWGPTSAGYVVAGWLVLFFLATGPRRGDVSWFVRGAADAAEILGGELHRAVTALTLHADVGHVLGNAISCAVFATLVCRRLGPGLGILLVLASGAVGNIANALVRQELHQTVGASTSLFGAVGILAGVALTRRRPPGMGRARALAPLAAGLGLVAMLGAGGDADLLAHLLGLAAGVPLGIAAGRLERVPGPRGQVLLAALAAAAVVGSWMRAFA